MSNLWAAISDPLGEETAGLIERVRRSVVVVYTRGGHGSGVVWDRDGLIVTNHHVAPRLGDVVVETADGRRYPASVVAHDRENDLALLRAELEDASPLPAGDSRAVRPGEVVLAVGHPHGVRGTATFGIISAAGTPTGQGRREVLLADLTLAPGNSGGPLVNARGEVIGIASMIVGPGLAIAVPSHVVSCFVARSVGQDLRRAA